MANSATNRPAPSFGITTISGPMPRAVGSGRTMRPHGQGPSLVRWLVRGGYVRGGAPTLLAERESTAPWEAAT